MSSEPLPYKHDIIYLRSSPLVTDADEPILHLDLGKEEAILDARMRSSNRSVRVRVSHLSRTNLLTVLAEGACILYLSGHIDEAARIVLEDDELPTCAKLVTLADLAADIRSGIGHSKLPPQLVVLALCYSATIKDAFFSAGVNVVVGVHRALDDEDAFSFMNMFFHSLLEGRYLHDAFTSAVMSLPTYVRPDFMLEHSLSANPHELVLFSSSPINEGAYHKTTDEQPHNLPIISAYDLSNIQHLRSTVVQHLLTATKRVAINRVITIAGPRRCYKTVAAVSAAHYLVSRKQYGLPYFDVIIFVDLHQVTAHTTIEQICNSVLYQMHQQHSSIHSCLHDIGNTDKYCFIFDGADSLSDDQSLCSFLEQTLLSRGSRCTAIVTSSGAVGCTRFIESVIFISGPLTKDEADERHRNSLPDIVRDFYQRNNRLDPFISNDDDDVKLIEDSYTQLAVIHSEEEKAKQDELRMRDDNASKYNRKENEQSFRDERIASFQDLHCAKEAIDIDDLFADRHQRDTRIIKKLIVYGRAGIGKSTMCKYISVMWAQRKLWVNKFVLVMHISLRDLIDTSITSTSAYNVVASLIRMQYLTAAQRAEWSVERIASVLTRFKHEILYLLDGYDEVASIVENDRHCTQPVTILLQELLTNSSSHHILTSRPMTIRRLATMDVKFDRNLENVGFSDRNVIEYVKKFVSVTRQNALLMFLQSRQDIYGIAHIPINLELICQVWKGSAVGSSLSGITTLSQLYIQLTSVMYERYTLRNQAITPTKADLALSQKTFDLELAKLAFHGIKHNRIIFTQNDLSQHYQNKQHVQEMLNSGILRRLKNGDAHFIHLTFQEYYAAYYVAQQIITTSQCDFLSMNKYDKSYEMVWLFTAGILTHFQNISSHYENGITLFWHIIRSEPRDMIGVRHACLSVLCWNECELAASMDDPVWSGIMDGIQAEINQDNQDLFLLPLMSYLKQCEKVRDEPLLLRCLIDQGKFDLIAQLGSYHDMVIDALRSGLMDINIRCRIFEVNNFYDAAVVQLVLRDRSVIHALISSAKYGSRRDRCEVIHFLGECGFLTRSNGDANFVFDSIESVSDPEHIHPLRRFTKVYNGSYECDGCHGSGSGTSYHCVECHFDLHPRCLSQWRKQGQWKLDGHFKDVIGALISLINDDDGDVCLAAVKSLCRMQVGAPIIVDALLLALKHNQTEVRCAAAQALGKYGYNNEVLVEALLSAMQDASVDVRAVVAHALSKVGVGSHTVVDALLCALRDTDLIVANTAANSLLTLGVPQCDVIKAIVTLVKDTNLNAQARASAIDLLCRKSDGSHVVIEALLYALDDFDGHVRAVAAGSLGRLRTDNQRVIDRLIDTLSDKNNDIRELAASSLAQLGIGSPNVVDALRSALRDTDDTFRSYETKSQSELRNRDSCSQSEVDAFLLNFTDNNSFTSLILAKSLIRLGVRDPSVTEFLVIALRRDTGYIRRCAAEALGLNGDKSEYVINSLIHSLEDTEWDVRKATLEALRKLNASSQSVIDALVAIMNTATDMLQRDAAQTFLRIVQSDHRILTHTAPLYIQAISLLDDEVIIAQAYLACENKFFLSKLRERGIALVRTADEVRMYSNICKTIKTSPTLTKHNQLIGFAL